MALDVNYGLFALCCLCFVIPMGMDRYPLRQTRMGRFRGLRETVNTKLIEKYLGIPYASPPVNAFRFKRTVAPFIKGELQDATRFRPPCPQPAGYLKRFSAKMQEDCLYLNVYVPVLGNAGGPIPVMVWIHGGGFISGSAEDLRPEEFVADGEVIVVTFNYRLGIMGFLSTGDFAARGNYGLWDQRAAIKWVYDNIPDFGGNRNRITVGGADAGAASVSFHALSPGSETIFRRLLLENGVSLSSWALQGNPRANVRDLSEKVGCLSQNIERRAVAVVNCLRGKAAELLVRYTASAKTDAFSASGPVWVPVVDHDFLSDSPHRLVRNLTYLNSSAFFSRGNLIGVDFNKPDFVTNRLIPLLNGARLSQKEDFQDHFIPKLLDQHFGHLSLIGVEAVNFHYKNWGDSSGTNILKLYTDQSLLVPLYSYTATHGEGTGKSPDIGTYFYLIPPTSSNERSYEFLNAMQPQQSYVISETKKKYWSNFVKFGDPNYSKLSYVARWPKFDRKSQKAYVMASNMSNRYVIEHPFSVNVEFWQNYLPQIQKIWEKQCSQTPNNGSGSKATTPADILTTSRPTAHGASPPSTPNPDVVTCKVRIQNIGACLPRFQLTGLTAESLILALGATCLVLALALFAVSCIACSRRRRRRTRERRQRYGGGY